MSSMCKQKDSHNNIDWSTPIKYCQNILIKYLKNKGQGGEMYDFSLVKCLVNRVNGIVGSLNIILYNCIKIRHFYTPKYLI